MLKRANIDTQIVLLHGVEKVVTATCIHTEGRAYAPEEKPKGVENIYRCDY